MLSVRPLRRYRKGTVWLLFLAIDIKQILSRHESSTAYILCLTVMNTILGYPGVKLFDVQSVSQICAIKRLSHLVTDIADLLNNDVSAVGLTWGQQVRVGVLKQKSQCHHVPSVTIGWLNF